MAVVSLKIGGRFYKFSCNDGQEMHMRELADSIDKLSEGIKFPSENSFPGIVILRIDIWVGFEPVRTFDEFVAVPAGQQDNMIRILCGDMFINIFQIYRTDAVTFRFV